jgi:hypothetical protein
LGLSVSGKVTPEAAKPAPDNDDALTVTGWDPVEDRVSVCEAGRLTATSPKFTLDVLKFSVGAEEVSCRVNVVVTPPALAVSVADTAVFDGETDAVKVAPVAPAATLTVGGTTTNELLLARFTVNPPAAAAAFSVTVQVSVPAPAIDALAQVSPVSTGTPVPVRLTAVAVPLIELLVSTS